MTLGCNVRIIQPVNYPHHRVFNDAAKSFELALKEAGMWAGVGGREITFGANLCPQYGIELMPDAIIMQMEAHSSGWMTDAYLDLLRRYPVLDYAQENVSWLRARGVDARYCPIRYHPHLTRLTLLPEEECDIDILFYGSMTPRRREVIIRIMGGGIRVKLLGHDDWHQRDDCITRSKIVLNLHAYEGAPFEMARVSYLLANGCFVISEGPSEPDFVGMLVFGKPEALPELCRIWLDDAPGRQNMAALGHRAFVKMDQKSALLTALEGL